MSLASLQGIKVARGQAKKLIGTGANGSDSLPDFLQFTNFGVYRSVEGWCGDTSSITQSHPRPDPLLVVHTYLKHSGMIYQSFISWNMCSEW